MLAIGDANQNIGSGTGAVQLFAKTVTDWSYMLTLISNNLQAGQEFGFSMAVSSDAMLVIG